MTNDIILNDIKNSNGFKYFFNTYQFWFRKRSSQTTRLKDLETWLKILVRKTTTLKTVMKMIRLSTQLSTSQYKIMILLRKIVIMMKKIVSYIKRLMGSKRRLRRNMARRNLQVHCSRQLMVKMMSSRAKRTIVQGSTNPSHHQQRPWIECTKTNCVVEIVFRKSEKNLKIWKFKMKIIRKCIKMHTNLKCMKIKFEIFEIAWIKATRNSGTNFTTNINHSNEIQEALRLNSKCTKMEFEIFKMSWIRVIRK